MDESVSRAVERTVLACRCLDGASDDLKAYARRGGVLGGAAADLLRDEAAKVEQIAEEIAGLEVAWPSATGVKITSEAPVPGGESGDGGSVAR